ncbi:MAG: 4'-phosphopantetheinyl transferase superfamily protein [bacterium]|nr:4'-phosphopantetheinyl transferase superfamily protein [bacterium]MBU1916523.1 4'-phosphopantetheinyl transferase superfamily protein [bacterium]
MVTPLSWQTAPSTPVLNGNDIHVYYVNTSLFQDQIKELFHLLSSTEQNRAQNISHTKQKNTFIITKAFLRKILSQYLGAPEQQISLEIEKNGKPFLGSCHNSSIQFNLAHSHDKSILAFCLKTPLGIDLEKIRLISHAQKILTKYGSEQEKRSYNAVPEKHKKEAFLRGWTKKEALIKAQGHKMATHANKYAVNFSLFPKDKLFNVEMANENIQSWALYDLTIEDYVGTIALQRQNNKLSLWHV